MGAAVALRSKCPCGSGGIVATKGLDELRACRSSAWRSQSLFANDQAFLDSQAYLSLEFES